MERINGTAEGVHMAEKVLVTPPGVGGMNWARVSNMQDGTARPDGSFTAGRSMVLEARAEGAQFRTSAEAVAWAEARGWAVINKGSL